METAVIARSERECASAAVWPTSAGLGRNVSSAVAGNLTYAASQAAITVVLAKLGTPEMLGQFALALALTAPVMLFSQLSLRAVQVTDARHSFLFSDYLTLRVITTCAAIAVITVAVISMRAEAATVAAILLVMIAKGLDGIADIIHGQWQRAERLDLASALNALNGLASVSAVFLALLLGGNIVWAAFAFAAGSGLALGVAVLLDRHVTASGFLPARLQPAQLWRLTKVAFPLGPAMLLVSLNGNIPRYFVAWHLGTHDLGIFSALSAVVLAGSTLIGALGQALSPRLARSHAAGDKAGYLRSLGIFALIAAGIGICGVTVALVAGEAILSVLYSPEYGNAAGVMAIAAAAAGVGYIASGLGYALIAARRFSVQVPLFAVIALATAVSAAILVPRFGIAGAAWAAVIGSSVQVCATGLLVSKSLQPVPEVALCSD